jgi:hypothetical protein
MGVNSKFKAIVTTSEIKISPDDFSKKVVKYFLIKDGNILCVL